MDNLKKISKEFLQKERFDDLSFALLDFKTNKYEICQFSKVQNEIFEHTSDLFFDLASVTKPLTMGLAWLKFEDQFHDGDLLLLEHRSGLPSWGLLSKATWRDQLLSYKINSQSKTTYSDFGALRLMLNLESKGINLETVVEQEYSDIVFWKNLRDKVTPSYGYRNGKSIRAQVHDPNAFTLDAFCSHAGLFASINSLSTELLNLEKKYNLLDRIQNEKKDRLKDRFIRGWDTVTDLSSTLAGNGCSEKTFGHLGFVGNHVWIDPEKRKGHILLTNFVKNHWYNQNIIRRFRKDFGQQAWQIL